MARAGGRLCCCCGGGVGCGAASGRAGGAARGLYCRVSTRSSSGELLHTAMGAGEGILVHGRVFGIKGALCRAADDALTAFVARRRPPVASSCGGLHGTEERRAGGRVCMHLCIVFQASKQTHTGRLAGGLGGGRGCGGQSAVASRRGSDVRHQTVHLRGRANHAPGRLDLGPH